MYLHRLNKDSLIELGKQGYKVVVCEDHNEQVEIYDLLKKQGKCARAATIKNREGEKILIVLTKENNKRCKIEV